MRTVLMVEDEPDFRAIVKRILEPAGLALEESGSAEEAWEKLEKGAAVDLLVVDWNLPGESGVELCRRIRADARFGKLPLVLLTVRNLPEEQLEGLRESGADLYLTKPINPKELLARVESLLAYLNR